MAKENSQKIKLEVIDEEICEKAIELRSSVNCFTEQAFKMYGGQPTDITIQFSDKLIGVVYDKFGEDTKMVRINENNCVASVKVQISPTFWGWLFQFGNIRRIMSSFFTWLEDENYILKSPVRRIHKIKSNKTVKETYTDEALETMRDQCGSLRDLAMIDLLASTGMRVGEMVRLNREDIDFENRECVVFGKGSKERPVYFDARTKIHLKNYLES